MSKYRPKTMPLPVRFTLPMRQRIQLAATRMGITTSGVIRFAVFQQLKAIESGVIHLANQIEEVKA